MRDERSSSRDKYDRHRDRDRDDRRDRRRDDSRDRSSRNRDRDSDRRDSRQDKYDSSQQRNNSSRDIELHGIYDGKVSNVLDFGCFVEIDRFRKEGLVHVSQIQQGMMRDIKQAVKRGDRVKVKVISMVGSKIGLSMKEVDQSTGQDLFPERSKHAASQLQDNTDSSGKKSHLDTYSNPINTGVDMKKFRETEIEEQNKPSKKKKISSPEMWEVKQLISSGVLKVSEYPTFDSEQGLLEDAEVEEDVDIELNDEEPVFLKVIYSLAINCMLSY